MDKPDHALIKYPRTPHLPFSKGMTSDDKMASPKTIAYLQSGIELVVSEKMDGGNLTLYPDYFHGRSLDSGTHAWDTMAKQTWSRVRFDIPEGWRVSTESLYARRSVGYENLLGPLYVFGIWNEKNELLSWDETTTWAALLDLPMVPTLYRGTSYKDAVKAWGEQLDDEISEGFVLRDAGRIGYDEFADKIAKMVRANHARTRADWRHRDDFDLNTFA